MMYSQPASLSTWAMPGEKNSNTIEPSTVSPLMARARSDRFATADPPFPGWSSQQPGVAAATRRPPALPSGSAQKRQRVGCGYAKQTEQEPDHSQPSRTPEEIDDARDEIGGGEHDGDLKRGGGELEVVVRGHGVVALGLCPERARHQLLAALTLVVGFGLALVACGPVLPVLHPFREQILHDRVFRQLDVDLHLLGCRLQGGLADGLGLIECPQVGCFHIEAQRVR